jgi:CheW-like domain
MTAAAPTFELLSCEVGKALLGIPRADVGRLIEYELAPLIGAAPYVGGLGVLDEQVVFSIALSAALGNQRRMTRGVLLRTDHAGLWSVEVSRVGGLVTATLSTAPAASGNAPPWLRRGTIVGGGAILAIDVGGLLGHIGAPRGAA